MTETIDFYLFEDNEIDFSLLLEGTDPEITDPDFRLVISDKTMTWVFKPERLQTTGLVNVKIPKGIYVMDKDRSLEGKLEIIIGDRYFSPVTFGIRLVPSITNIKADITQPDKKLLENNKRRLPIVVATLASQTKL